MEHISASHPHPTVSWTRPEPQYPLGLCHINPASSSDCQPPPSKTLSRHHICKANVAPTASHGPSKLLQNWGGAFAGYVPKKQSLFNLGESPFIPAVYQAVARSSCSLLALFLLRLASSRDLPRAFS